MKQSKDEFVKKYTDPTSNNKLFNKRNNLYAKLGKNKRSHFESKYDYLKAADIASKDKTPQYKDVNKAIEKYNIDRSKYHEKRYNNIKNKIDNSDERIKKTAQLKYDRKIAAQKVAKETHDKTTKNRLEKISNLKKKKLKGKITKIGAGVAATAGATYVAKKIYDKNKKKKKDK
jgi:hypothetical protein